MAIYVIYTFAFGDTSEPIAAFTKESDAEDFMNNSEECRGGVGRMSYIPLDPDWKEYGLYH